MFNETLKTPPSMADSLPEGASSGQLGSLGSRRYALAFMLYLATAVWLFRSAWAHPRSTLIGHGSDPTAFVWFLKWTQVALREAHNPFFTQHLNHPDGVNLMWNTLMPLPGLVMSPVTATLGPVVSYNVLMTLAVAGSACVAYVVLGRYAQSRLAAFLGGLLYGFSPYMMAHAFGHLNLVFALTPPLLLALLDEILVRQRRSPLVLGGMLGLLTAAQLLISEELLATEALAGMCGVALLALLHRRGVHVRAGYAAKALGTGLLVGIALTAWPLWVQFFGPQRVHGVIQTPGTGVNDLLNLIVPTEVQLITPPRAAAITSRFSSNVSEWTGYLGIPLLLLLSAVIVRWWRRPLVRLAALLALALTLLSFGPRLHVGGRVTSVLLPWAAIDRIPVFANIVPGRLMLYVFLLASLLLALFVDAVVRAGDRHQIAAGVLVVLLALVPLVPRWPRETTPVRIPTFFTSTAVRRIPADTAALVAPLAGFRLPQAELWQAESGMRYRMPGGYFIAPGAGGKAKYGGKSTVTTALVSQIQFTGVAPELNVNLRHQVHADLQRWKIRTVIVGPMRYQAVMVRVWTGLLGRPPERVGDVNVWWDLPSGQPSS